MTSIPTALTVSFVLVQENLHLWKLEGQHRLCHAGAGGHDREVRGNGGASGGVPATGGGRLTTACKLVKSQTQEKTS